MGGSVNKHWLSKSTYVRGLQCVKSLYLNKNHKDLKDELSEEQLRIFSRGSKIGELARGLFPGGKDATPENFWDFSQSLVETKYWVSKKEKVIFEAAFQHAGVLIALDVLVCVNDKWYAYEVKSASRVSNAYVNDAALQYWVINQCGIKLEDFFIVHINPSYVRGDELDLRELFTKKSVLSEILEQQEEISQKIPGFEKVLEKGEIPEVPIGTHCNRPYPCDFKGYCWKDVPEDSIFDLHAGGELAWELYGQGILKVEDIPDSVSLSKDQKIQVEARKTGKPSIDLLAVKGFMQKLKFPLFFFDIECFTPAVPMFSKSRAYQPIPFLFSVHKLESPDASLEHVDFIVDTASQTPRLDTMKQMIDVLGNEGTILAYGASFEKKIIKDFGKDFKEHRPQAQAINSRIVDLLVPFEKKWVYHPKMKGKSSLKVVLPALIEDLDYTDLDINNGNLASSSFEALFAGEEDSNKDKIIDDLRRYCKLDTYALVKLYGYLRKLL